MSYDAGKFWALVDVKGTDDCWMWLGRTTEDGYGRHLGQFSHRLSLFLSGVPLDSRNDVDHMCGVKGCVSPFHLRTMRHSDHSKVTRRERCGI